MTARKAFTSQGFYQWATVADLALCRRLRASALQALADRTAAATAESLAAKCQRLARSLLGLPPKSPTVGEGERPIRNDDGRRHIIPIALTPDVRLALGSIAAVVASSEGGEQDGGNCGGIVSLDARLVELNYTIARPGAAAQATHSDVSPLLPDGARLVTFWLALQPTGLEVGPTEVWATSHELARDFLSAASDAGGGGGGGSGGGGSSPGPAAATTEQRWSYNAEGELEIWGGGGGPMTEDDAAAQRQKSAEAAEQLMSLLEPRLLAHMTMEEGGLTAMDCRVMHRGGANSSSSVDRVLLNATFQQHGDAAANDDSPAARNKDGIELVDGFTYHVCTSVMRANLSLKDFLPELEGGNSCSADSDVAL